MCFERKVAGVEEADNRTRIVALESLGPRRHKERVIFAPHRQKRRLVSAEVVLECRIQCNVAFVVAEEVKLYYVRTGTSQIKVIKVLAVRRHHRRVRYAVGVLPTGCLRREESMERLSVRRRRVLPVGFNGSPALAETFVVCIAVLRDDGRDALGVADSEPETYWRTVVKDVGRKPIEADDLCKTLDHTGDVVERVTEFLPRRHVGLTKSGKVRRDDMKSVGEQWDQVAEHVTRAREAMQQ